MADSSGRPSWVQSTLQRSAAPDLLKRLWDWLVPCACWCCSEGRRPGAWLRAMELVTIPRRSEDDTAT